MSNGKFILFMKEEVLNRDLRPCWQKQSRTGLDGEEVHQTLSASSVEIYVSSLMALWKTQFDAQPLGGTIPPPSRLTGLKNMLKKRNTTGAERRREQYEEGSSGTGGILASDIGGHTIRPLLRGESTYEAARSVHRGDEGHRAGQCY